KIRDVTLRNRIAVSPMCQYSCVDGLATEWHLVHLGSRAVGGAALVCVEASAVEPIGRISPEDMGLWSDRHIEPLARIARFGKQHGAIPAIQLAHAGRKASTFRPWAGRRGTIPASEGGWTPVAPSAVAFDETHAIPDALDQVGISRIVAAFAAAAGRALAAGFEIVEIHSAHGYLLHEFLSPISNLRHDEYGGALANRSRALLQVVSAIRRVWPERLPLFVRISATDWAETGGWTIDQSVELCQGLREHGIDLVDVSSGGTLARASIPAGPGFQ